MPAIFRNNHIYGTSKVLPLDAEDVTYSNSETGLQAEDAQAAIDELYDLIQEGGGTDTTYILSAGTGADADKIILTPSRGTPDKVTVPYATNAGDSSTVNGKTVAVNVPADAVFTDTTYTDATTSASGLMSSTDKTKLDGIETGAEVNVQSDWNQTTTTSADFIKNKPTALSAFTNDQGFITNAVNDLTNYYTKSNTYTKSEVNSLIELIPTFSIEVVDSLLIPDPSPTTIYLLLNSSTTSMNLYTEYIYIIPETGEPYFEKLGEQTINLSDYYTSAQVDTLLANKQNATDNNLQTTDKTVVGAVNELKSGLINLADDVKLNTQDLTTPSRTKNLLNYDEWKKVNVIGGSGVFENNGITLTATADCYTGYNNTNFPINARIPISEGETITLSWQANNDLSGIQYIFPNGSVSGAVSKNNANGKSLSYTADPGVTYVTFRFGVGDAGNSIEYSNIQIEKGNTATPFAPYIPSVETRLDAVERGKISKFHSVSSFNTSGLAKWCKIATITVTHGSWLQQYFMVAYNGYAIVSVKLRSTATDDFNNDETKITRIAGTNVTFGIKISDDYLTADMYIKSSAVQSSRYAYTILSEGGDGNGITFIDPIITSLTDTDMTISN